MRTLLASLFVFLSAALCFAAAPAHAQRVLSGAELEYAVQPFAHFPDRDIVATIAGGANADLAYTFSVQPSEVWRAISELRQRAGGGAATQVIIVHHVVHTPVHVRKVRPVPPNPNGPPSPAVQLQQGHLPGTAVRLQQERIPEAQRQPIVHPSHLHRHWKH